MKKIIVIVIILLCVLSSIIALFYMKKNDAKESVNTEETETKHNHSIEDVVGVEESTIGEENLNISKEENKSVEEENKPKVNEVKSNEWRCYDGYSVPMKRVDTEVACASQNGKHCLWGYCKKHNNDISVLKTMTLKPLKCGEQHKKHWGGTGYNNKDHWCHKLNKIL